MTIKMILATDEKGGIGSEGKLPWHIPEDLQYFKEMTYRQAVVMGNETFKSLPFENGLPSRYNYVLSSCIPALDKLGYRNVYVNHNMGHVTKFVNKNWILTRLQMLNILEDNTFIIGGASIYEQLFPFVEEIYHTCVKGEYSCDTFVDTSLWVNSPEWKLVESKVLCDKATVNIWRKI